jgi:MFS family permease
MLLGVQARKDGAGSRVVDRASAPVPSDSAVNLLHSAPETDSAPSPLPDAAAGETVERFLQTVRRRQARAVALESALLASAAAAFGVALAGLLARTWPRGVRWVVAAAVVVAVGLVADRIRRHWTRAAGNPFRTARLVAARMPGVSLDLLAVLELRRAMAHDPAFSTELALAHLKSVDARAAHLDAQAVVDRGAVRRAGLAALGALATLALVCAVWPDRMRALLVELRPAAASGRQLAREPITGELELLYQYPAYTGLAPRTVSSTGDLAGPKGTVVQLRTRADRAVSGAQLVLSTGPVVPLHVEHGRDLSGSLVLQTTGTYAVVFTGRAGREMARGPDFPLTVEPDTPPQATILLPGSETEVDPDQEVMLRWEASDDYGLSDVALVWTGPDGQSHRQKLAHDDGRKSSGQYRWPLGPLKLSAGDRVAYSIEAQDNDAVDGPQKGSSRQQTLVVYSAAEHRREALRRATELWERLLAHLATRMEGPDRDGRKSDDKVRSQEPVDTSGLVLSGDIVATARALARERDRNEALVSALQHVGADVAARVRATADARKLWLRLFGRRSELDMDGRLTRVVQEEISALEKDALYLESLLDQQRLEELRELAGQMAREQRELAKLIEQFQSTRDAGLQEKILRQVAALRNRMDELARRMAELQKSIRDEHYNLEALNEMARQQDMQGGLDDIEKLLKEGKTEEALARLQQLQAQMSDLQKRLEENAESMGGRANPELVKRYREFSDALKTTTEEQRQLAEQTKAVRDRYREQMRQRMKQAAAGLKEQLQKKVDQVAQDYLRVGPNDLSPRADQPLEQAKSELENLKSALKSEDFDLAAEAAQRAVRQAEELARAGEQQRALDEAYQNPPDVREKSRRLAQRLEKDAEAVRDIRRKLDQLFPPLSSQLGQGDRQKLQDIGQGQRKLSQRAQDLQQKMRQLEQMAPLFGEQGEEALQQISDRMAGATERLEGKDPQRGYGEQKAALDSLEQLQQSMQQSQRGGGRGGLPLPLLAGGEQEGGNDLSRQKVEVPDADPEGAPREFRKDLLDAMKQGTPERYRDQVKRYYEELVK